MKKSEIYIIALLIAATVVLTGCGKKKKVYILNDCEDVQRIANLYDSVEQLGAFFERHEIDTLTVDTLFDYCGYILKADDRTVQIDTIFSAVDLKQACLTFFDIDEPLHRDSTSAN